MSEAYLTAVFGLGGVVIGFALSQGADLIKAQRRSAKIKKAVTNELSVVKEKLSTAQKDKETSTISDEEFPLQLQLNLKVNLQSLSDHF